MTRVENRQRIALAALRFVNTIRTQIGLSELGDLIPGVPGGHYSCPIAASINADAPHLRVRVSAFNVFVDGHPFPLDGETIKFVRIFDQLPHNAYPQYVSTEGRFVRRAT